MAEELHLPSTLKKSEQVPLSEIENEIKNIWGFNPYKILTKAPALDRYTNAVVWECKNCSHKFTHTIAGLESMHDDYGYYCPHCHGAFDPVYRSQLPEDFVETNEKYQQILLGEYLIMPAIKEHYGCEPYGFENYDARRKVTLTHKACGTTFQATLSMLFEDNIHKDPYTGKDIKLPYCPRCNQIFEKENINYGAVRMVERLDSFFKDDGKEVPYEFPADYLIKFRSYDYPMMVSCKYCHKDFEATPNELFNINHKSLCPYCGGKAEPTDSAEALLHEKRIESQSEKEQSNIVVTEEKMLKPVVEPIDINLTVENTAPTNPVKQEELHFNLTEDLMAKKNAKKDEELIPEPIETKDVENPNAVDHEIDCTCDSCGKPFKAKVYKDGSSEQTSECRSCYDQRLRDLKNEAEANKEPTKIKSLSELNMSDLDEIKPKTEEVTSESENNIQPKTQMAEPWDDDLPAPEEDFIPEAPQPPEENETEMPEAPVPPEPEDEPAVSEQIDTSGYDDNYEPQNVEQEQPDFIDPPIQDDEFESENNDEQSDNELLADESEDEQKAELDDIMRDLDLTDESSQPVAEEPVNSEEPNVEAEDVNPSEAIPESIEDDEEKPEKELEQALENSIPEPEPEQITTPVIEQPRVMSEPFAQYAGGFGQIQGGVDIMDTDNRSGYSEEKQQSWVNHSQDYDDQDALIDADILATMS
jgi:hypothetical protein